MASNCLQLTEAAADGVAPALRAVDCLANETTSAAFGRLFGSGGEGGGGALLPALTIILTLYIAWFAVSLLTGRSRIGISALTPRMMTMGMVLTFATSWVAYQGVVWNLAVGAPDQIAGILMGAKGSATQLFGDRVDLIFAAIAEAGQTAGGGAQGAAQQTGAAVAQGSFTPANLMWLAALLLLLGTVGVLVTARIALAVLLALGPIFVIFGLFGGSRGLTAGWLRGVVLTAVTPLFVVVGGGIMLELLVPVVANLRNETGINGRAALALFTIAAVHVALMAMVLKVMGTMVGSWQVFGLAKGDSADRGRSPAEAPAAASPQSYAVGAPAAAVAASSRARTMAAVAAPVVEVNAPPVAEPSRGSATRTIVNQVSGFDLPPLPQTRGRGVGSRFRAQPTPVREMRR